MKNVKEISNSESSGMDFSPKEVKNKKNKIVLVVLLILVVIFGALTFYYYKKFSELNKDPLGVAEQEVNKLLERVSEHIVLPSDERPNIATVNNPESLKNQPFFANAKNGDVVLLYPNSRKAILYDPVLNKILEVAPLILPTVGTETNVIPSKIETELIVDTE
ncbi:MAG: hypothetical protein A2725_00025 [Candidatus Magasanikbacteria bacterium RIFCSPHIGHO2_01_FULL_33_34]|uniref:Uncharacterized protein n=1 Tax=Candidatus Magasanikbacteria bacterium RIFCSPHIGHO2_01_FULL_33_34 TaxID=1798671 RepID=A0A1F6LL28_9BACT|nr:MAG: hypothetical protein A2725_00025 [Candidatus Magasanikbacteria bacterium RIFCSPHIGHO2_01_FULL_33_34]OGH65747.1 MAG: hypothetical protein A3B83_02695 [Candidatus Magasanikbacteria bacterium RIFCSPHIGHO2_02_FULL_33_17]OGH75113.1 MAG: hypothetical protein A3A89_03290 [Candidatus Magasanikbacteria bacterium RIFCSPLOWO2_01_FULL_33_34]OGH81191.1 MAG: hypothetical protein A3F93_03990 [Candidatus Magasanikbacteria bacterium RIFCSPLOWO2_12_FULL_34_7]